MFSIVLILLVDVNLVILIRIDHSCVRTCRLCDYKEDTLALDSIWFVFVERFLEDEKDLHHESFGFCD